LDADASLVTDASSSPLIISSTGELLYPAAITTNKSTKRTRVEPALILVDLPHQSWRKMVLPV
jgi:hypothetical protein